MAILSVVGLLLLSLGFVSATLLGPVFVDFSISPSLNSLSPQLATQSLSVDSTDSLFVFAFSLANPDLYLSGGLSVNFTLNSNPAVPLTQNFSYPFNVAASLDTFVVTIGLFETPCTTAPNCNTTYVVDVTRTAFPVSSTNNYDTVIIVSCVLGATLFIVVVLTVLMFIKTKKFVASHEAVALVESS